MEIQVEILRYHPENNEKPGFVTYEVEADPRQRVLDVLRYIRGYIDGTLSFREACGSGICGSDAMIINGRNALACKTLVSSIGPRIRLEPMRGFPVIKDLIVDMEAFFDKYAAVKPYLIAQDTGTFSERRQTEEERARYDETSRCIMCGACTTACPSFWSNEQYLGPAAVVTAHRFLNDSRDEGRDERLEILNQSNGVWRCRTVMNCVDACPRGIDIFKAIAEIRLQLLFDRF